MSTGTREEGALSPSRLGARGRRVPAPQPGQVVSIGPRVLSLDFARYYVTAVVGQRRIGPALRPCCTREKLIRCSFDLPNVHTPACLFFAPLIVLSIGAAFGAGHLLVFSLRAGTDCFRRHFVAGYVVP
jgi:hypothetical protein